MKIPEFTDAEMEVIVKAIQSYPVQNLMGAEEWDLTDGEEEVLWDAIRKAEAV